ncbi:uncharacterized protein EI90DRAFT_3053705 [Cantharellus anzutake]|uniref:uncharacterized protein n=1 Tax=Cantharellus anzutake TaxID=1750568 RepID=UPI001904FDCE|nr:uncharacterized protein EI90DRAFT_3053705 [Cantharellus anzutake]KAF8332601.1 hypothetical protein EI90DRAFT_3053705 [Cantharellus anzutake]
MAEQTKKSREVASISLTPFSPESQNLVLDISSQINGRRVRAWTDWVAPASHEAFLDPEGLPPLSAEQSRHVNAWRRPCDLTEHPVIYSDDLRADQLHQSVITDCSLVAGLAVCLNHHSKFRSKLGISCLHPQNGDGTPIISSSGKYQIRFQCNGIQRKIEIDDRLPCVADNSLACLSTHEAIIFLPSLIEKAYMKLNGGYDFPGSDSSIDVYALTRWIPEVIRFKR